MELVDATTKNSEKVKLRRKQRQMGKKIIQRGCDVKSNTKIKTAIAIFTMGQLIEKK